MMNNLRIAIDQKLLQADVYEIGNEWTVISTHCLDTFAVHFVVFVRPCEIEARVSFLVDQQIGKIALLEFELDGFDECGTDEFSCLAAKRHCVLQSAYTEFYHYRIGVAVNYLGIMLVAVLDFVSIMVITIN